MYIAGPTPPIHYTSPFSINFGHPTFRRGCFLFFPSPGQEKMILEVVVVVVRQQYCKARYLQVGRELEKRVWEPCGSSLGSDE